MNAATRLQYSNWVGKRAQTHSQRATKPPTASRRAQSSHCHHERLGPCRLRSRRESVSSSQRYARDRLVVAKRYAQCGGPASTTDTAAQAAVSSVRDGDEALLKIPVGKGRAAQSQWRGRTCPLRKTGFCYERERKRERGRWPQPGSRGAVPRLTTPPNTACFFYRCLCVRTHTCCGHPRYGRGGSVRC